ncbi:hypothetical protein V6N13_064732 [Hibiscus sabdariffa]
MNMFEGSGEFENPRLLSDGLPSGRPTDYSLGSDALVMVTDNQSQQMQQICSGPLMERPDVRFMTGWGLDVLCQYRGNIESCVGKNGKDDDPKESSTNAAVEIATKEVPTEERGLFGPWMAVESRRKRSSMGGQSSSRRHGKQVSNSVDNRFTVLDNEQVEPLEDQRIESSINMANERVEHISEPVHGRSNAVFVEDNRDVSKNDAYRASNPESKAKESRQVFEKAVVMPMVEGQQVSVVKHNQTGGSKVHVAVSLFEKGYERVAWMGLCWGRRVGEGKAQKMAHSRINDIATHSELDPGGSTWVVVNQDGGLEPVVSMYIKQGIQTVVLDMVSSGEGRDSIADQ